MMDQDVDGGVPPSDAPTEVDVANEKIATPDAQQSDTEMARKPADDTDWDNHPTNPRNWPAWKKTMQMISISSMGFVTYAPLVAPNEPRRGR